MKREMRSQRRWNIPSPGSPYSGLSQAGPGQMTAGQSPPILVLELGPPNGHSSGQFGTEWLWGCCPCSLEIFCQLEVGAVGM
ncbi:unnamed protein product [Boreogadus saida]